MFCTQCGNKVEPQNKFCAKCGSKIAQTQKRISEQTIIPPVQETAVWIFPTQRKYSLLKIVPCNIVFMTDKAILANLTPEIQKAENARLSHNVKANGIGFFKGSAAMMQFWAEYHKKYYSMAADQILSEDASNLMIWYQNVKKVVYRCHSADIDSDGIAYGSQGKLSFDLYDGNTYKFTHTQSQNKSVKDTLVNLFGNKLTYKK